MLEFLYIDLRERLAPAGLTRRPEAEQAARDFLAEQRSNDASSAGSGR